MRVRGGAARRGLPALALLVTVGVLAAPAQGALPGAATTSGASARVGPVGLAYRPPPSAEASLPNASAYDDVDGSGHTRKRVLVGFSAQADVPTLDPDYRLMTSSDGGGSFPTVRARSARGANFAHLLDGSLLDVQSEPAGLVDEGVLSGQLPRTAVRVRALRSTDGGASWTRLSVPCGVGAAAVTGGSCLRLRTPLQDKAFPRFYHGITTDVTSSGEPALLMTYYGAFLGDLPGGRRTEVARSVDGGRTWSTWGTIGVPVPTASTAFVMGYSEATMTHLPDGRLYAVLRADLRSPVSVTVGLAPLAYSVSSDHGQTWTTPLPLLVGTTATSEESWTGVDPSVVTMPNGVLVLTAGRPDNHLAVADGLDATGLPAWRSKRLLYANYPTTGEAYRSRGSSGYLGLVAVSANRALVVADNCGPTPFGCPSSSGGWVLSNERKLVKLYADVVTADAGKIDLASGVRSGRIAVLRDDFTYRSARHPETGRLGAFDGSTDYWSSAVARPRTTPAQLVLRLDRSQRLTRVGIALGHGFAGQVEVLTSQDPSRGWTAWPAATLSTSSYSLGYVTLPAGTQARYVQVRVLPSSRCAADVGDNCAVLGELELYGSSVRSFENDAVGGAPRGVGSALAEVVLSPTGPSSRAVALVDRTPTRAAYLRVAGPRSRTRTWEAQVSLTVPGSGHVLSLEGADRAGHAGTLYRVVLSATRGLRTIGSAKDLPGTTGLFAAGTWHTVRIVASATSATVYVDGRARCTVRPPSTGVSAFTTTALGTSTAAQQGSLLLDELVVS